MLFYIQMFDYHSDSFVDRTRNFDSDLTKSRLSCCCSVSFLHPILRWRRFSPLLLFLNRLVSLYYSAVMYVQPLSFVCTVLMSTVRVKFFRRQNDRSVEIK